MNAFARWIRYACCALVMVLFLAPRAGLAAEQLIRPLSASSEGTNAGDIAAHLQVQDVITLGGQPMAFVTDPATPMYPWLTINGRIYNDNYSVKAITREGVVLAKRGSDQELKIPVMDSASEKTGVPAAPARFSKAWINSSSNLMQRSIVSPPFAIFPHRSDLTEPEKKDLASFYERYGWKLIRLETIAGAIDIAWERPNEAELVAAAQAKREAFLNLLSPEQKELWLKIQSNQPIYAVEGKFTDEQRKVIAERQPIINQFQSSLTAEQRAAREEMLRQRRPPQRPQGSAAILSLPRLAPADPVNTSGPAPYTKAWINSKANPMLHRFQDFPGEVRDLWSVLTTAERTQVVEFYQKHGWQLLYLETVSGNTGSLSWRNIYEKERSAVLKANREAFMQLLSPEQRQAWQHKPSNQLIYIADGKPDYAKYRTSDELRSFFDQFWSTLNARQRTAYEKMHDFTQADWK